MAVSERGGKNNSGDYEYLLDADGSLIEFPDGHPQAGQPVVNQDLVNYGLRKEDLADASQIPDEQLCVAEAFARFAQRQKFGFWQQFPASYFSMTCASHSGNSQDECHT